MVAMDECVWCMGERDGGGGRQREKKKKMDTKTNRWCTQVNWTHVYEKIICSLFGLFMFLLPGLLVSYTRNPPYTKETINRVKRQPMTWKKIFLNLQISDKDITSRIQVFKELI